MNCVFIIHCSSLIQLRQYCCLKPLEPCYNSGIRFQIYVMQPATLVILLILGREVVSKFICEPVTLREAGEMNDKLTTID